MISCLCVTRGDRAGLLAEAIADFAAQTLADRELIILHDRAPEIHAAIAALADAQRAAKIRVLAAPPGQSLGALRNLALDAAGGDWICQWDDDDRYHPGRLAVQFAAAEAEGAAACYLVDQLHWFAEDARLCWDDWDSEPYPLNLIQGSILARRAIMPPYPDLPRGEDTGQTHALLRAAAEQGFTVARLRGAGWCHIYRQHGANVWEEAHHRAISTHKHLAPARLLPRLPHLRARLAEYSPSLPVLHMALGAELVAVSAGG